MTIQLSKSELIHTIKFGVGKKLLESKKVSIFDMKFELLLEDVEPSSRTELINEFFGRKVDYSDPDKMISDWTKSRAGQKFIKIFNEISPESDFNSNNLFDDKAAWNALRLANDVTDGKYDVEDAKDFQEIFLKNRATDAKSSTGGAKNDPKIWAPSGFNQKFSLAELSELIKAGKMTVDTEVKVTQGSSQSLKPLKMYQEWQDFVAGGAKGQNSKADHNGQPTRRRHIPVEPKPLAPLDALPPEIAKFLRQIQFKNHFDELLERMLNQYAKSLSGEKRTEFQDIIEDHFDDIFGDFLVKEEFTLDEIRDVIREALRDRKTLKEAEDDDIARSQGRPFGATPVEFTQEQYQSRPYIQDVIDKLLKDQGGSSQTPAASPNAAQPVAAPATPVAANVPPAVAPVAAPPVAAPPVTASPIAAAKPAAVPPVSASPLAQAAVVGPDGAVTQKIPLIGNRSPDVKAPIEIGQKPVRGIYGHTKSGVHRFDGTHDRLDANVKKELDRWKVPEWQKKDDPPAAEKTPDVEETFYADHADQSNIPKNFEDAIKNYLIIPILEMLSETQTEQDIQAATKNELLDSFIPGAKIVKNSLKEPEVVIHSQQSVNKFLKDKVLFLDREGNLYRAAPQSLVHGSSLAKRTIQLEGPHLKTEKGTLKTYFGELLRSGNIAQNKLRQKFIGSYQDTIDHNKNIEKVAVANPTPAGAQPNVVGGIASAETGISTPNPAGAANAATNKPPGGSNPIPGKKTIKDFAPNQVNPAPVPTEDPEYNRIGNTQVLTPAEQKLPIQIIGEMTKDIFEYLVKGLEKVESGKWKQSIAEWIRDSFDRAVQAVSATRAQIAARKLAPSAVTPKTGAAPIPPASGATPTSSVSNTIGTVPPVDPDPAEEEEDPSATGTVPPVVPDPAAGDAPEGGRKEQILRTIQKYALGAAEAARTSVFEEAIRRLTSLNISKEDISPEDLVEGRSLANSVLHHMMTGPTMHPNREALGELSDSLGVAFNKSKGELNEGAEPPPAPVVVAIARQFVDIGFERLATYEAQNIPEKNHFFGATNKVAAQGHLTKISQGLIVYKPSDTNTPSYRKVLKDAKRVLGITSPDAADPAIATDPAGQNKPRARRVRKPKGDPSAAAPIAEPTGELPPEEADGGIADGGIAGDENSDAAPETTVQPEVASATVGGPTIGSEESPTQEEPPVEGATAQTGGTVDEMDEYATQHLARIKAEATARAAEVAAAEATEKTDSSKAPPKKPKPKPKKPKPKPTSGAPKAGQQNPASGGLSLTTGGDSTFVPGTNVKKRAGKNPSVTNPTPSAPIANSMAPNSTVESVKDTLLKLNVRRRGRKSQPDAILEDLQNSLRTQQINFKISKSKTEVLLPQKNDYLMFPIPTGELSLLDYYNQELLGKETANYYSQRGDLSEFIVASTVSPAVVQLDSSGNITQIFTKMELTAAPVPKTRKAV